MPDRQSTLNPCRHPASVKGLNDVTSGLAVLCWVLVFMRMAHSACVLEFRCPSLVGPESYPSSGLFTLFLPHHQVASASSQKEPPSVGFHPASKPHAHQGSQLRRIG